MKLIRRKDQNPACHPFSELEYFNQFFDNIFPMRLAQPFEVSSLGQSDWYPEIDVCETPENIVVRADIPGLKKEDIDVSIEDNILLIKGEKKKETETKDKNYYRTERSYGSFVRSLRLPSSVEFTQVKGSYQDGVLELTLPKKEEAKIKNLKVDIK